MENRSDEWEIVDYYPCLVDEESDKSKLGWVIDTGQHVGKKLVMAGVVISSVPLLFPPLVVISALGLALSVPFSVLFASYACTQKLMSKLLPSPALSGLLDNQEEDQPPVVAIEKEEEEEEEDLAIKDGIETRIELVDNEDDDDAGPRDEIRDEQERLARDKLDDDFPENVQVGGLNKAERDQHSLEQGEDEKPYLNVVKTDDYTAVSPELTNTGVRNCEGGNNVGNQGEDASCSNVEVQTDKFVEEEREKNAVNKEEREDFLEDKNEEVEKTITGIERTKKDEKHQKIETQGENKTLAALKFPGKRKETEGDNRHGKEQELPEGTKSSLENTVEGELGLGEKFATEETSAGELVGGGSSEKKRAGEKECIILRSEECDSKHILVNGEVGNIDSSLEKEEEHAGFKDSTASKTTEGESANGTGVDQEIIQCSMIVHDDPGENHSDSMIMADDEAAASNDEEMPHLKDRKDALVVDSGLHSAEGLSQDEKIWEKIDAIRAIVGFKTPRRPSYLEELKALYIFTGIEPPSTTMDPCDFADFYNKLRFLMSVIGLK